MLKAYVNYPNQKVSVHHDPQCGEIQKMFKANQRSVRIDCQNISAELKSFGGKAYPFAAEQSKNDMWIEVTFGDAQFEDAVLAYLHRLIGNHYSRLAKVTPVQHC